MATGKLKVLQKLSKYEFGVELHVMREGKNLNGWDYQNIDNCYLSFVGRPILCAFPNKKIGDGHNMKEVRDPKTGEVTYSFLDGTSERIVGTLSDDPKDFRIEEMDGEKWLIAKGRLFTFYSRELVENIVSKGVMEVSAETEISEMEVRNNVEVFTDWIGLGVTILGEGVAPAIPNARIEELRAMSEEFKDLCLRAASYIEQEGIENIDDGNTGALENNTNKPQQNTNEKGVKSLNAFSKKQLAALEPKFAGYRVLAAGQDDNGIHVCLVSNDCATAVYTMGSIDDVVVPEKIVTCNAQLSYSFGEEAISVDSCELTDPLSADIIKANTKIEALTADLNAANDKIKDMETKEATRRLSAAKDKAESTLKDFNANRDEKIADDVLTAINSAITNGEYSEACDADGNWIGESKVAEAVLAACAKKVMEQDKLIADKNRRSYIWDNTNKHTESESGVAGLLSRMGVE